MQSTEAQKTVGDNWREIVDPSFYTKAGWPEEFVAPLKRSHNIDNKFVEGVWHADFLESLCSAMGIEKEKFASKEGAYAKCKAMALEVWLLFYEEEEKSGKA